MIKVKIKTVNDVTACGGFIQAELGVITSPNYPLNYPSNTECVYDVVTMVGSTITVTIDTDFQVTNSDNTCNGTNGDYLRVCFVIYTKIKYDFYYSFN